MKVILVSGRAGTGKGEFAKRLKESLAKDNIRAVEFSFAEKLKDIAKRMGWKGEKTEQGRKLLQGLGMLGREYDPDMWVNEVKKTLDYCNNFVPEVKVAIIADWRFPNEYEVLKDSFDITRVRVHAPERERLRGTELYNHISETSLLDSIAVLADNNKYYDWIVLNDPGYNLDDSVFMFIKYVIKGEK